MQLEDLQPCCEDRGTSYPTTQAELDFHQEPKFRSRNKGPFVTPPQATAELIRHNDLKRQVPHKEQAAIDRLLSLIKNVESGCEWGSDIPIKLFADLDLVLFGGKLRGNVCVKWMTCDSAPRYRSLRVEDVFGLTTHPRISEKGQCYISLNADTLLNDGTSLAVFQAILCTLLHEMCHAYDHVRCPRHWLCLGRGDAHGETFCTRISAVHRRAKQVLRLEAIGDWEDYMRPHSLAQEDEGGYLACGEGKPLREGGKTKIHRWSRGHIRSGRNGGSKHK
jgi:hypothetical protein